MTTILLHNIKEGPTSNYDSRERLEAFLKEHPNAHLTFDGVYESVWENRDLLVGRRVTLFVVGGVVGSDNSFDRGQPIERYCTYSQLHDLMEMGCTFGYHSWSHPDLTTVPDQDLLSEVDANFKVNNHRLLPEWIQPEAFAYPYGKYNERVIEAVKAAGYKEAYSTNRGDNTRYALKRQHLPR